jgi:hypothetical protein
MAFSASLFSNKTLVITAMELGVSAAASSLMLQYQVEATDNGNKNTSCRSPSQSLLPCPSQAVALLHDRNLQSLGSDALMASQSSQVVHDIAGADNGALTSHYGLLHYDCYAYSMTPCFCQFTDLCSSIRSTRLRWLYET